MKSSKNYKLGFGGTKSKKRFEQGKSLTQQEAQEVTSLKISKFASNPQYLLPRIASAKTLNSYQKYFDYDQLPNSHKSCISNLNKLKPSHQSTMFQSGKTNILKRIKSEIISTSNQGSKEMFDTQLNYRRRKDERWMLSEQFHKKTGKGKGGLTKKNIKVGGISKFTFGQGKNKEEKNQESLKQEKKDVIQEMVEFENVGEKLKDVERFEKEGESVGEKVDNFCLDESEVLKREDLSDLNNHSSDEIQETLGLLNKNTQDNCNMPSERDQKRFHRKSEVLEQQSQKITQEKRNTSDNHDV